MVEIEVRHFGRVLVCGSRTFPEDDPIVTEVLDGFACARHYGDWYPLIIEGGARGADRAAFNWVQSFQDPNYPHLRFDAE